MDILEVIAEQGMMLEAGRNVKKHPKEGSVLI